MPMTSSGATAFTLDVGARQVKLLELSASTMDPKQDKWHFFSRENRISLPYQETRAFGPPSAAQRMPPAGAIPPASSREMEYRYRIYAQTFGASADMFKDELQDAKNIGGAAAEMVEKTWNVIPEAFRIMRCQFASALLVYSFPASVIPAALAPYLNPFGADGLTAYSNSHTYNSTPNTWSNLLSADGSPSVALLQSWYSLFVGIRTPKNYPNIIRGRKILCDSLSKPDWDVVLNTEFQVDSANNNLNKAKFLVKGTEHEEWEWLPSNFSVMICDLGDDFMVQHVVRRNVEIEQDYEKATRRQILYGTSRENFMWPPYTMAISTNRSG